MRYQAVSTSCQHGIPVPSPVALSEFSGLDLKDALADTSLQPDTIHSLLMQVWQLDGLPVRNHFDAPGKIVLYLTD